MNLSLSLFFSLSFRLTKPSAMTLEFLFVSFLFFLLHCLHAKSKRLRFALDVLISEEKTRLIPCDSLITCELRLPEFRREIAWAGAKASSSFLFFIFFVGWRSGTVTATESILSKSILYFSSTVYFSRCCPLGFTERILLRVVFPHSQSRLCNF